MVTAFLDAFAASCFAHLWTMFAVAYARVCGRSAFVPNQFECSKLMTMLSLLVR